MPYVARAPELTIPDSPTIVGRPHSFAAAATVVIPSARVLSVGIYMKSTCPLRDSTADLASSIAETVFTTASIPASFIAASARSD